MGSRASKAFKYSTVAPTVEAMVKDAAEHFVLADAVLGNERRFAPPLPSTPEARPIADTAVGPRAPLAIATWAASQSLVLHRLAARSKDFQMTRAKFDKHASLRVHSSRCSNSLAVIAIWLASGHRAWRCSAGGAPT